MYRTISISFPDTNVRQDFGFESIKGDTVVLIMNVFGIDLEQYTVRAELRDCSSRVQVINTDIAGIEHIEAESGMTAVKITFPAESTKNFYNNGQLEVEIEDDNGVFTLVKQNVRFEDEIINWTIPA